MSGPKVVRIVTREEIIEICRGHLARVDAALEEWIRIGSRNDCIDDEAIRAAQHRRQALAALLTQDRFNELQKQAPQEEAFIRDDLQFRLAQVIAKGARGRARERRERDAAMALLKHLRATGTPLDRELEAALERADAAATSQGMLLLGTGVTKSDGKLLQRLKDGERSRTFADWVEAQPAPPADPVMERLESRIEEIAQFEELAEVAGWRLRLREAEQSPRARRELILDALEVETGRALTTIRAHAKAVTAFRLALAEAAAGGVHTSPWKLEPAELTTDELTAHTVEVQAKLEVSRHQRAVEARRAAVLEGLNGLGYEVREGMSTSWASEGRLVLRSATRPEYGVELSGTERLQMKPVAFEANGCGPDPSKDRDAETIWCGDVRNLEKRLAELGDALQIERSLPIGAVPLKRVVTSDNLTANEADVPVIRQKSLK